jgi:hypothetical protein
MIRALSITIYRQFRNGSKHSASFVFKKKH